MGRYETPQAARAAATALLTEERVTTVMIVQNLLDPVELQPPQSTGWMAAVIASGCSAEHIHWLVRMDA